MTDLNETYETIIEAMTLLLVIADIAYFAAGIIVGQFIMLIVMTQGKVVSDVIRAAYWLAKCRPFILRHNGNMTALEQIKQRIFFKRGLLYHWQTAPIGMKFKNIGKKKRKKGGQHPLFIIGFYLKPKTIIKRSQL